MSDGSAVVKDANTSKYNMGMVFGYRQTVCIISVELGPAHRMCEVALHRLVYLGSNQQSGILKLKCDQARVPPYAPLKPSPNSNVKSNCFCEVWCCTA